MQFEKIHHRTDPATWPTDAIEITDAEAHAGARFAIKLFDAWYLTDKEACILLGAMSPRTYSRWKQGKIGPMDADRRMRLSLLAGIHKGLRYLFSDKQRRDAWVKKPNQHFADQRPLDIMLQGRMTDLIDIRTYLDALRG